jgi:phage shock protein C
MSEPKRRLYRSRRDRKIAGVCGGMAEYWGIDPVIPRLIWVAFALAAGSGLLAYLICWMVIPSEPAGSPVAGS